VAYHAGHWEDSDALTARVYGELGRCDVLINNAGMSPLYGDDLTGITEEYYDKVTGVNLKGPFRLSSLIGQRMADGQGGSIINVSTIGSLRPTRHELVYACAKAGLNALTLGLAEAYGPKVRANAILPGAVDTDIASVWSVEQRRQAAEASLLKRMGTPQDFVGAALWLASDASSWVTGTVLRVDGGALAQL
jgi:NAD(P)-dependent dehydrogenase (short-subunit alcohol dehydrogenase family)